VDPTGTTIQPVSGTITANQGTNPWTVAGNLSDNATNPTTKVGILPATSQTQGQLTTAGNIVPLIVDRNTGSLAVTTRLAGITGAQVGNLDTLSGASQNVGSFNAVGNIVQSTGYGSQIVELIGAFVGTIVFEIGSTANSQWFPIAVRNMNGGQWITSTTGPGLFAFPDVGSLTTRLRSTAWTSGLPSAFYYFGNPAPTGQPWNGPTGIPAPPQAVELGATDPNSNLQSLQLDASNNLKISSQGIARISDERLIMLTELASLNSLIASDNGPGARNYQELR
jgi:hypothetical protein